MSGFIEDCSDFLTDRRNSALEEAYENSAYTELKSKCMTLSKRLLAAVPAAHASLVIGFFDALTSIGSYETMYCYLRGLFNGDVPEVQFDPTTEAVPDELLSYEQYSQERAAVIAALK